ncbi:MAG: YcaQ family DNA glycosylase [Bacteroidetes bacterium]|nr:YcaQ family DNA glycosylase [Bacteroidota bacterium]
MNTITPSEARRLYLHSQGLYGRDYGRGKAGALNVIEHIGYVQIDTIAVVERAHHHTLFTRVKDYKKSYLDELMEKDKAIFEYWSHAAAYLPMRDYRYSLPRKKLFAEGKQHWFKGQKPVQHVYDRIKAEGALQSKDFEEKRAAKGWYEWKTTKQALEQLFMAGQLMVAGRRNFQKVYDLTERVLPQWVDASMPTEREMARHLILGAIDASGFAAAAEISYLRRAQQEPVRKALAAMLKSGELQELKVNGLKDTLYTTAEKLEELDSIRAQKGIHILSPFDNAIIQRRRLINLFDFDYTIECYVPEPKRVYGYFVLPVLYGDTFAGRLDAKADAATQTFIIRNMWVEEGFRVSETFLKAFAKALKKFAAFNRCEMVKLAKTSLDRASHTALKELLK